MLAGDGATPLCELPLGKRRINGETLTDDRIVESSLTSRLAEALDEEQETQQRAGWHSVEIWPALRCLLKWQLIENRQEQEEAAKGRREAIVHRRQMAADWPVVA